MSVFTFFANPSVQGISLAVLFGLVWLTALRPLNLKCPAPWLVLLAGAILFAPAIAWVQAPLQTWVGGRLIAWLGPVTVQNQIWFTAIPLVLLSGLVQEAAKLVPVTVFWWVRGRNIDPKLGLTIGAMAGAGFAVVEAQWVLNTIFASGWNWDLAPSYGFMGFAGFWERFFTVAFHIASAGLAGWGLSKGFGWQFYLLVSGLHFMLNYTVIFLQMGVISTIQIEIVIAVLSSILFAVVLGLRWRKRSPVEGENNVTPAAQ